MRGENRLILYRKALLLRDCCYNVTAAIIAIKSILGLSAGTAEGRSKHGELSAIWEENKTNIRTSSF
jgi:hypothetical protein